MAEEIEQLRALRGIPKGLVTKMVTWTTERGETASTFELDVKIEQLKKYELQFEKVQSELELKDVAERDPEAVERGNFEDKVATLKARLMQLRSQHAEGGNPPFETSMGNISLDISGNDLPKFDLPSFDGDYKAFPLFMDSFNALVHQSRARGLTDVKRLAILRTSLTGKALEAIKDLPLGGNSYAEALLILKERFENKRLIFDAYIKSIWEMSQATNTTTLRRVCDSASASIRGLRLLGSTADIACGIITHLLLSKCDAKTVKKWEEVSVSKVELIQENEFIEFLKKRCTQLESVEYALGSQQTRTSTPTKAANKSHASTSHVNSSFTLNSSLSIICPVCDNQHALTKCDTFLSKSPRERYSMARVREKCARCLDSRRGHRCSGRCDVCHGPHHTLLHFNTESATEGDVSASTSVQKTSPSTVHTLTMCSESLSHEEKVIEPQAQNLPKYTFLPTALVLVKSVDGNHILLRLLLDGGSQSHLISERAAKLLGLPQQQLDHPLEIRGINSAVSLTHAITAQIKSLHHDMSDLVTLVVHRKLKQMHPSLPFDINSWNIPTSLRLADQKFNIPQDVDIILNANQAFKYLLPEQHFLGTHQPFLQNTRLGWVVVGDLKYINDTNPYVPNCTNTITDSFTDPLPLHTIMEKFWEVETVNLPKLMSPGERQYENQFKSSYSRKPDGRFVVKLPFTKAPSLLGASHNIALRRLWSIKRKMDTDEELNKQYREFMDEYISLGHCTLVNPPPNDSPHCYIPHFAVHNPDSTTTKTRVVFDASCRTESGVSLNDLLLVGPTIQKDLVAHMVDFRSFPVAITGDLSKMYRNIDVASEDRPYQLILWFNDNKICTYCLNTVTYGTASAPFAAIRCLHELADTDGADLPLGAQTLRNNFYVDDWLGGAETPAEAIELHEQLQKLLSRGQFTLRKIQSNSPEVMQSIPHDLKAKFVTIGEKDVHKTLGMNWLPQGDYIVFHYEPGKHPKVTKRAVLSETGRFFDSLGLLQPVIVKAKIFMQQLWARQVGWDESLAPEEEEFWLEFQRQLREVNKIIIPRLVCQPNAKQIELHGFCDASERAYCACIYVRSITGSTDAQTRLLVAKTKVAPLKTVTLPRLELLGAFLLAQLFNVVREKFPKKVDKSILWSDSTITLKWINSSPHKWVPYVGTRVTKIQLLTNEASWRHVPTHFNPADVGSRGMLPLELQTNTQWFQGPEYLKHDESQWPAMPVLPEEAPDTQNQSWVLHTTESADEVESCKFVRLAKNSVLKFLAWSKIRRVFGYVNRFISRMKTQWRTKSDINTYSRAVQPLSATEIADGTTTVVQIIQHRAFPEEIKALMEHKQVPKQSKLSTLGVFRDQQGVIRVGGRLKNAPRLTYDEKFPIVLPHDHAISELIVSWAHCHNLHAPQTALLAFVRQQFWPIKGKVIVNKVVRECIRCCRCKPVSLAQIMADLPEDRVSEVKRPFLVTAVDFAGPFVVHYKGRGSRTTKVYVAVYVCFSTKAVHLDVVENLSTEAFLDSLRRFVGRRGVPAKLYSDNGTNFVGSRNKINEMWKEVERDQEHVHTWCRDTYGIEWKFMPPRTPHFGGLHEAAVKGFKSHLIKVVAQNTLTLWEMTTLVTMVEGVLNSRPLIPLAMCPQDNQPLTPGHFLIGNPLNALPDPIADDLNADFRYSWSKTVVARQLFWRRWSKEYLQSLQQRYKWSVEQQNVKINDLVLLIDRNHPSITWTIGKIEETFPGKDGKVRVVSVRTKFGTFKRGITEICALPKSTEIEAGASMGPGMSKID